MALTNQLGSGTRNLYSYFHGKGFLLFKEDETENCIFTKPPTFLYTLHPVNMS